jgi:hypothetical protein
MNYSEIVDISLSYSDRNDIDVTKNIDNFILMAEARMNRLLKTGKQSARVYTPTVADQEFYSLPPDFLGARDIQLNTQEDESSPFEMLTPVLFNQVRNSPNESGKNFYSIIGQQIQIYPIQDAGLTLEITYYQKVPNLSDTTPSAETNWMAEENPDVYLAGITGEIELFAKNYDVAAAWFDRMSTGINEISTSDKETRWSGTPLVMRLG